MSGAARLQGIDCMFVALLWLLSAAWDGAMELALKFGFICSVVVIGPTYLGATIVVAQALDAETPPVYV